MLLGKFIIMWHLDDTFIFGKYFYIHYLTQHIVIECWILFIKVEMKQDFR